MSTKSWRCWAKAEAPAARRASEASRAVPARGWGPAQPETGSDLWTLTPSGKATPLVLTPFNDTSPRISADGRYVAYVSDESGREEGLAIPMSGKGERTFVSINGGSSPVWSRDGKELFYRAGDVLMSVTVNTTGALTLGDRRRLIDLTGYDSGDFRDFDVSADGHEHDLRLERFHCHQTPVRLYDEREVAEVTCSDAGAQCDRYYQSRCRAQKRRRPGPRQSPGAG